MKTRDLTRANIHKAGPTEKPTLVKNTRSLGIESLQVSEMTVLNSMKNGSVKRMMKKSYGML